MTNHKQPTKEELEAMALKAAEEAEALKALGKEEADDEEDEHKTLDDGDNSKENKEPEKKDKEGEEGEQEDELTKKTMQPPQDVPPAKTPEELEKELEEAKKKLRESSRESMILHSTNQNVNEAIAKSMDTPAPTDDDMKSIYPEWEDMDETTKKIATENVWNSRKLSAISEAGKTFRDFEAWEKKVDEFISDPTNLNKYQHLDGAQREFKEFALKKSHHNADFDLLASAFRNNKSEHKPNKGGMLESGGSSMRPVDNKPKKLSLEEARNIRVRDYGEFTRLLKAGMIDMSI